MFTVDHCSEPKEEFIFPAFASHSSYPYSELKASALCPLRRNASNASSVQRVLETSTLLSLTLKIAIWIYVVNSN